MFLKNLIRPQIAFDSTGSGGGGGSSSNDKPKVRPKARPVVKKKVNPNEAAAASMKKANLSNLGGKQIPVTPHDDGNPAISETNSSGSKIVGGLDPNKKVSMATNEDGSLYHAYDGKDAHNYNAPSKNNPDGKFIMKSTIPDNDKMVKHTEDMAKKVDTYNDSVSTSVTTGTGGGGNSPVSPEVIKPLSGVGGGRDGGAAGKSKAGKTDESKLKIKRTSKGVKDYRIKKSNS